MAGFPYWLAAAVLLGLAFVWVIVTRPDYQVIFHAVITGIVVTIYVTVIAYALSLVFGLLIGLMRVSHSRVAREIASFYVEIVRGVPMLVILLYVAFVAAPALVSATNGLGAMLQSTGSLPEPGTCWQD